MAVLEEQNDRRDPEYLLRLAEVIAAMETQLAVILDMKVPDAMIRRQIGGIYRRKDELKAKGGEHLLK